MTMDYSPSQASQALTNGVSASQLTLLSSSTSSSQTSAVASKKLPVSGDGGSGGGGGSGGSGSSLPPRIDLEPIYDGLRSGLTLEQWIKYKEALSAFVMGRINRLELSLGIDPIITGPKQRLHNQLLLGMYHNTFREPPPADVAPWVLATNKAANALGASGGRGGRAGAGSEGGDAKVEARLKVEVMALAPRDRRRIKEVPELSEIEETLPSMLYEYHLAKQMKIPEAVPPQSATPNALNNKTNWEAEIKTRYTLPLSSESGEFPDLEQIRMRMLPICYEEGVVGGVGDNTAQFMNVAAELFVKEILSTVISRVRCNRPTTIKTDAYKRKLEEMNGSDDSFGAGIYAPPPPPPLPPPQIKRKKRLKLVNGRKVEVGKQTLKELAGERKVLGMNDLRLSFTLGDNFLTQLPLSLNKIMAGGITERQDEYYQSRPAPSFGSMKPLPIPSLNSGRNQPSFVKKSAGGTNWSGNISNIIDIPDPGAFSQGMVFGIVEDFDDGLEGLSWDRMGMGGDGDIGMSGVGWDYGGWEGGGKEERMELRGLLDECLSVGM